MLKFRKIYCFLSLFLFITINQAFATDFSNNSYIIVQGSAANIHSLRFWNFLQENCHLGLEIEVNEENGEINMPQADTDFSELLIKIQQITEKNETKIFPVFITFKGSIAILDSVINQSGIARSIFYLPQGEAWPSVEYLIQSKRRILFFVKGNFENESHILHRLDKYVLRISADGKEESADIKGDRSGVSPELFMIDNFEKLPTKKPLSRWSQNLVPDYINFLLENWLKYGKRPNFIFIGTNYSVFAFIISQLNSFTWINGTVKTSGKILERVYWKNPEVLVTGGKFSFPYRGGEELALSAFVPGFKLTPQQIVITGEMEVPESYNIIASPIPLAEKITANFTFEGVIHNTINPVMVFNGENYSFSQDIERGSVLKLPENASINLGNPEDFGLRNSSFTVSCFVKFSEILEFGDNAILGNYESEYRRGLHLVLRSGHPYFGLWSNDFVSEVRLKPNIWYHLTWRYTIETGEQAIFLDGKNIGSSNGHPPFSGTGDIQLGSALSKGANLRGYIDDLNIWGRALGNEEINKLALNEEIFLNAPEGNQSFVNSKIGKILLGVLIITLLLVVSIVVFKKVIRTKNQSVIDIPQSDSANQILLFGDFKAINQKGEDVSEKFTPKVKELFLFILIHTLKNNNGALISDINEQLWPGLDSKKVTNNRAVTLNKLRRILIHFDGIEIVIQNRYIKAKMESDFFCDYAKSFNLCKLPGVMSRKQLEAYFELVKKGRFLKGITLPWLDEIRGITGNRVIDNLLNLAMVFKKENKLKEIDAIAKRILDYDDLNEEAIFLQTWSLSRTNNLHLAKFSFQSFCTKYKKNLGENYPMDFDQFTQHFSKLL